MDTLSTPFPRAWRRSFRTVIALGAVSAIFATAIPASASSAGPTDAQRLAQAQHELRTLFASAPLPAGSRRISASAAETIKPFAGDKSTVYPNNEVAATKFFVAPSAATSLTWLKHRPLEGHAPTSSGSSGVTSAQVYLLGDTAVLEQPEVVYIGVTKKNGTLEYSVTASVWWLSQKPALAVVPTGATKLIVTVDRGVNVKVDRSSSATSDNRTQIAAILHSINTLQEPSPLPTNCPIDVGATLTMSFYRANAKNPYSVVVADPGGCGTVTVSQYAGTTRTAATDLTGGVALSNFVAAQLGLKNL